MIKYLLGLFLFLVWPNLCHAHNPEAAMASLLITGILSIISSYILAFQIIPKAFKISLGLVIKIIIFIIGFFILYFALFALFGILFYRVDILGIIFLIILIASVAFFSYKILPWAFQSQIGRILTSIVICIITYYAFCSLIVTFLITPELFVKYHEKFTTTNLRILGVSLLIVDALFTWFIIPKSFKSHGGKIIIQTVIFLISFYALFAFIYIFSHSPADGPLTPLRLLNPF